MRILLFLFFSILVAVTSFQLWMTKDNSTPPQAVDQALGQAEVQIGGAFTLTDQHGTTVNEQDFRGKIMLVFFGFTHCPDICPVTVATLSKTMELLGDKAQQVAPVFITVDPERDTPEVMSAFLENFDKRIIGLTGTQDEISKIQTAYKAYAAKSEATAPEAHEDAHDAGHDAHGDDHHEHAAHEGHADYVMDHSAYIYLMDKNGSYSKIFASTATAEELARAVERALQ